MYAPVPVIEEYLKANHDKPFLSCEYSHAMGNSNGGLWLYTDLAKREPRYQGGFIWDFIDQGLLKKDAYGNEFLACGGDYGDRPTDYNFCTNGLIFGNRQLSPKMAEVKQCYAPFDIVCTAETITVKNRLLFTDTSAYRMVFRLCRDDEAVSETCLDTFEPVPPLEERVYSIPFPVETQTGEYVLTVSMQYKMDTPWAKAGEEVAFGQAVWQVKATEEKAALPAPELIVGDVNYGIRGENFHILFGRDRRGIISYQRNGEERIASLVGIPRPNFWRAPTDNDFGWGMPHICAFWKAASLYAFPTIVTCERLEQYVEIVTKYQFPILPETGCMVTYHFYGDGLIQVKMSLYGCDSNQIVPDFGMIMRIKI